MAKYSTSKKGWKKVRDINVSYTLTLGNVNAEALVKDPKHFLFTLSRYKFAAKMLQRCKSIVDIGCGEGVGELMFLRETKAQIVAIDFDERQIEYAKEHILPYTEGRVTYLCQDIITKSYKENWADGLACMDVIEHINPLEEDRFLNNCSAILKERGVALFGTPNECVQQYASERSKLGHINLFSPDRLLDTIGKFFSQVFLFSMNDEMVHTGFNPLAHYLMVLCIK